jgi:hypothetical protein
MQQLVSASRLSAFVKSSVCMETNLIEGKKLVQLEGNLELTLKRPLRVEFRTLKTGYSATRSLALETLGELCSSWQAEKTGSSRAQVLFETCGVQTWDDFYIKPSVSSVAVRVSKVRSEHRKNDYCKCRTRKLERTVQDPIWGDPIKEEYYVFDLMALLDEGYYNKLETFNTVEDCQDEMNKQRTCTDEEGL